MKPRDVLCTTAAILVFGLAPLAGSQPDQKDHGKKPDQGQPQAPQQAQRQPPGQAKRQQPPARNRQQPVQARRPDPGTSVRQRQAANPGPSVRQRQAPDPGRFQRPVERTPQFRSPTQRQQQRPVDRVQNRQAPPQRQVGPITTQPRTGTRVQQQTIWPRYRASSWTSQHRTWVQRGGYGGYRIPRSRFVLYFGRPHRFHLSSYTVRVVGSYPEFYADGYWFTLLDPVPEYWDDDWYDVDYCTVVELDNGYYLVNDSYPDVLLAVSVQL